MGRVKCSLCGFVFEADEVGKSCGGCILANNCAKIHCPNCGYVEVAPRPGRRNRGWFRRRHAAGNGSLAAAQGTNVGASGTVPLADLPEGARGRVVKLDTTDRFRLQKLLALGLLPGVEVEVAQRFPCFVLNLGLAQVALDAVTAQAIWVAEDAGAGKP